jgi:chromosome segregation ATPase
MKFIFPILAILVCLGAAYFTWTESEKFTDVQDKRLVAISTNKSVTAKADVAGKNIADEKDLLEQSKDSLALVTQSVSALASDAVTLKSDLAKLDVELEGQNAQFAELEKALKKVQAIFAAIGEDVTMETLPVKIAELEEGIKAKRAKVEDLEALIDGAKSSLASKQADVQSLVKRKGARNKRIARNAMEARITAVNQDWGFLVIGAGANSGFTPQTTLLVKRDGRLIGKVNPSAIEATQTIAEIDLKSLSPGVRIQRGDSVILAKPASN